jgi:predicted lipase
MESDDPVKMACILSKEIYRYSNTTMKNLDIHTKTTGLVFGIYMKTKKEAFIVFKGTSTLENVISDLDIIQVDDNYNIPGKFHKGFHDLILKNETAEKIYDTIPMSVRKIYVTGHSLGAALATVFYAFIKKCTIESELITFGSPKVGDLEFAEYINHSSPDSCKRYVNGCDVIAKIPVFGFAHVDTKYQIGNKKNGSFVRDHSIDNYLTEIFKM